ncbi:hypothetical protein QE436_000153 [Pantoea anthophila]|nr:hypothetical protein [Pantoea anthophila]
MFSIAADICNRLGECPLTAWVPLHLQNKVTFC